MFMKTFKSIAWPIPHAALFATFVGIMAAVLGLSMTLIIWLVSDPKILTFIPVYIAFWIMWWVAFTGKYVFLQDERPTCRN